MFPLSKSVQLVVPSVHEYIIVTPVFILSVSVKQGHNLNMPFEMGMAGYPAFHVSTVQGNLIDLFRAEELGITTHTEVNAYAIAKAEKYFSYKLN